PERIMLRLRPPVAAYCGQVPYGKAIRSVDGVPLIGFTSPIMSPLADVLYDLETREVVGITYSVGSEWVEIITASLACLDGQHAVFSQSKASRDSRPRPCTIGGQLEFFWCIRPRHLIRVQIAQLLALWLFDFSEWNDQEWPQHFFGIVVDMV